MRAYVKYLYQASQLGESTKKKKKDEYVYDFYNFALTLEQKASTGIVRLE